MQLATTGGEIPKSVSGFKKESEAYLEISEARMKSSPGFIG